MESHAAGEPLRVITGGLDPVPGSTILEKRRFARERLDGLRRGLVFEPRGHADMYGAIPTEPVTPDGDAAWGFTTPAMYRGMADAIGRTVKVYSDADER